MGRYSSDSDDSYRESKKKKKRSRSRSNSSDDSRRSSRRSKKSKKKSSKRYSRSRSRSSERSYRKKRSRSRDRRRSRSRSRTRKRSRSRHRSRSHSRRSRSRSRCSRSRRLSKSKDKEKRNRSKSPSEESRTLKSALENVDPCLSIPGFADMSQSEKNETRMKMAIKAAAATDAKLREQGLLATGQGIVSQTLTFDKQQERVRKVQEIDSGSFVQQNFSSTKGQIKAPENSVDGSHESAIFSATSNLEKISKNLLYKSTGSLMGPIFYEDVSAKWDRWVENVKEYRQKRLEGDQM